MPHVTATEFQQNVGNYSDAALIEPVIITSHKRDRLVLLGVDEYRRLRALDEQVSNERKAAMESIFDTHQETFEKLASR